MIPAVTTEMFVVFALVLVAVALFVTELIPPDTTAIAVVVALVILQPWTGTTANEAISGFASSATVTILAMYVLSGGVQKTGTIRRLGVVVARYTHGNSRRLLGATVGLTAPLAGFINNTPVVAMFIPMVTDLADDSHVSPSKLLIPLSYASMLGGTLTLIGTATNILASDIVVELTGRGFSMFEFTPLGLLVMAVGLVYLVTVGQVLLPERIESTDLVEEFDLGPYLSRVYVRHPSPIVGQTVAEALSGMNVDVDVLQIVRGDESYIAPGSDREVRERDVLTVRGDENSVAAFCALAALRRLPKATVTEDELADPGGHGTLIEAVVGPDSSIAGDTIHESNLRRRFGATVLAVRRGQKVFHDDLAELRLEGGGRPAVARDRRDRRRPHRVGPTRRH
jgi:di/tricarboxylate transporter